MPAAINETSDSRMRRTDRAPSQSRLNLVARALKALVQERLTAAAEEIFALFERTIAEFEEELRREKDLSKQPGVQMFLLSPAAVQMSSLGPAGVQMSLPSPGLGLNQIKEEPEEQSVKQEEDQLPE
ncbi:hypothetical protein WMY93_011855 [Mugilogobius chulae]|uniref:Uncharacterized protein n=1 Tax=Mugilogobius chulae TaxID=88201 RepID=A0AAW0PDU9_9GOBI